MIRCDCLIANCINFGTFFLQFAITLKMAEVKGMGIQNAALEDIAGMQKSSNPDKAPKERMFLVYTFDTRGYDCFFPVRN